MAHARISPEDVAGSDLFNATLPRDNFFSIPHYNKCSATVTLYFFSVAFQGQGGLGTMGRSSQLSFSLVATYPSHLAEM